MNATPVQPTSANWSDLELTPLGSATGGIGLPGDFSSPSRFVRVAFLRAQILMEDIENDGIIEFFHILNNVAMVKGSVITKDGKDEITQYSSCMNLEKGLYYYQGNDFASELVYSVGRLCEPCLEHIDNNFKPLDTIQKGEFADVTEDIVYLLQVCRHKLENNNYNNFEEDIHKANDLNGQLAHLKREELQRIQSQSGSIKVSMVYLTMIQEAQNIVTYSINLMKVSRKFQAEE